MKNERYEEVQTSLILYAGLLIQIKDLNQFLERINHAETLGPITDPTLYIKGADMLQYIKVIASSLQTARVKILKEAEAYYKRHPNQKPAEFDDLMKTV